MTEIDLKSTTIQPFNPFYPTYILTMNSIERSQAIAKGSKSPPLWNIKSPFIVSDTRAK